MKFSLTNTQFKKQKILVILLGNARGSKYSWLTLKQNVLMPLDADLALCFGHLEDKSSMLYEMAKYVWEIEEFTNWRTYYEKHFSNNWENFFTNTKFHKCGISGGIDNYSGSGAILFALRHFIKNNYLDVLKSYDQIILTRSDHLYLLHHPFLFPEDFWIVEGEDYGGITDRHHVFPSSIAEKVLSIADFIDDENTINLFQEDEEVNTEKVISKCFESCGLLDKIRRFDRTFFTVATQEDQTRWRKAILPVPGVRGLFIKYKTEFDLAHKNTVSILKKN